MKKTMFKALALLLASVFLLSACGGKSGGAYTVQDVQTLLDAGVFSGQMERVDKDVLLVLYGIDAATVEDCAGALALDSSVSADEVAVLVLTDEQAAQDAEAALEARVADQMEVCATYCPGAIPSLESAVVDRVGNTVLLAVGDPDALPQAVEALGK